MIRFSTEKMTYKLDPLDRTGTHSATEGPPTTSLWGHWKASEAYTGADGTGSLITTDATAVYSLKDLSGNGRHFNQSTGANQFTHKTNQLNSLASVESDGTNDSMSTSVAAPATMSLYAVFKYITGSQTTKVAIGGLISNYGINNDAGNASNYEAQFNASDSSQPKAAYGADAYKILSVSRSGTDHALKVNNDATATGSKSSSSGANIRLGCDLGGVYYTPIGLAELIIYNTAHDFTTGDGLLVRQYLNTTYNLGLTL